MPDDQNATGEDSERQLRERAYAIWEEEGRPEGRHHDHWHRARSETESSGGASGDIDQSVQPAPVGDGMNLSLGTVGTIPGGGAAPSGAGGADGGAFGSGRD